MARSDESSLSGSNSRYTLYDLVSNKEKDYHVSDLKEFLYDLSVVDPLDVARRDHMEFFVESARGSTITSSRE